MPATPALQLFIVPVHFRSNSTTAKLQPSFSGSVIKREGTKTTMADEHDFNQQLAHIEFTVLSAATFKRQLWTPPAAENWLAHHQDPLLADFGSAFIFLCRVRDDLNTARPTSYRGAIRSNPSLTEIRGDYNLTQLARQSLMNLVHSYHRAGPINHTAPPCVTLDDFQETLLAMVLERHKDNFEKGLFYSRMVHDKLSAWRYRRIMIMLEEAVKAEAFDRECFKVLDNYLLWCQHWLDKRPYVNPLGLVVSLEQMNVFLNNVERAQGYKPKIDPTSLRRSYLNMSAFLRQQHGHLELLEIDQFPQDLRKCIQHYVGQSTADLKPPADMMMAQIMPPYCADCQIKLLAAFDIPPKSKPFCINCSLMETARQYASDRYTMKESVRRIKLQLTKRFKFCPHCLEQSLRQLSPHTPDKT